MHWYVNAILLAAIFAIGWIALELVAQPIRQFFDLRRQLRQQLLSVTNIAPPMRRETAVTSKAIREYDEGVKQTREAQRMLCDFGSQMLSFDENEFLACNMVKCFGFDVILAGRSLFGLSNAFDRYSDDRAVFQSKIEKALRF